MTDRPRDDPDAPGAATAPAPTDPDPTAVAARFLHRALVVDVVSLVVGGLLLGTGIGGVTYLARQLDHLARTGVVATATAVAVVDDRSRFQFDEHVTVTFRVHDRVVRATAFTNADDRFAVGEPVVVVYDPADPTRAQLATNPSFGPAGTPFFAAVLVGLVILLAGGYRLVVRRAAGATLREPGRDLTVGRSARHRIAVRPPEVELRVRGQVRRLPGTDGVPLRVFGGRGPGAMLVGVHRETGAVVYGRIPREGE